MTTTMLSARKENRFDKVKDLDKVTPLRATSDAAPSAAQQVQEWFDAHALPVLPLHLHLMLLGN